jgi:hypothetical protein
VPTPSNEKGAALLIAILTTMLLAGLAASLVYVSTTETLISAAFRHAEETSNAADAALERALLDLDLLPDWTPALLPASAMSFSDGQLQFVAPDGRRFDLGQLTLQRQRESDASYGGHAFGADTPQWRLYAHARLGNLLPAGTAAQPAYLVVWVADDGWDGDGNPFADSNQLVLVHAEAYGAGGARRAFEASVGRADGGWLELRTRRAVP